MMQQNATELTSQQYQALELLIAVMSMGCIAETLNIVVWPGAQTVTGCFRIHQSAMSAE